MIFRRHREGAKFAKAGGLFGGELKHEDTRDAGFEMRVPGEGRGTLRPRRGRNGRVKNGLTTLHLGASLALGRPARNRDGDALCLCALLVVLVVVVVVAVAGFAEFFEIDIIEDEGDILDAGFLEAVDGVEGDASAADGRANHDEDAVGKGG